MTGPSPGPGLVAVDAWRARQDDYLAAATTVWVPTSPLNVLDHLERAHRDPSHEVALGELTPAVVDHWCHRIDRWLDCADFDVLRLLTLVEAHGERLPAGVAAAVDERLVAFTYWYDDPHPPGVVDERWYWSENHRLIFHAVEHLAGARLAGRRFDVTGLHGADHRERGTTRLHAWLDEKAELGFSEWHSDVYYEKDLAPLLTLVEFSPDPAVAARCAAMLDLLTFDLALHHHRGNLGCTHGRSYMKDKSRATDQPVFGALRMMFDGTTAPWPVDTGDTADLLPRNEAASLLARAGRWRPPDVLRRIATTTATFVDRERMGLPIDPDEPLTDRPGRTDGRRYDDPDLVPFWWDRGALTPWQLVPLTVATLDRHHLWDAWLFSHFRTVRDAVGGDPADWRALAAALSPMVNAGLLSEVETCTWRSEHAMLSTAQSYRPGCAGFQHHIGQATLDEDAVVFVVHPGNEPSAHPGDYLDEDRYWTGSATLPRAVQHGPVAVHLFAPAFADPGPEGPMAGFSYRPYTHAYFPTDHFDETTTAGHWVVGRRGRGLVALWSWRRPEWRHHDPTTTFTNGLTGHFDLVAPGGPENVWLLEVGDTDDWGSLPAFARALEAAPVEVTDHGWGADGAHLGVDVSYTSPRVGRLEVPWRGTPSLDGVPVPLHDAPRFDNPFCHARHGEHVLRIADDEGGWELDLRTGRRGPPEE